MFMHNDFWGPKDIRAWSLRGRLTWNLTWDLGPGGLGRKAKDRQDPPVSLNRIVY